MKKHGITNDDIQEIFNFGLTESQTRKTLERNGFKTGILYQYDGYSRRYVIISVFRRPLKVKLLK